MGLSKSRRVPGPAVVEAPKIRRDPTAVIAGDLEGPAQLEGSPQKVWKCKMYSKRKKCCCRGLSVHILALAPGVPRGNKM